MFTDQRIVGEIVGGNAAAFLVGGVVGLAIADAYHKKKSKDMNEEKPEAILSKDRRNFSIDYQNIDEIQLKKKNMKLILNQKQKIIGKKPVFYFPKKQLDDIKSILIETVPNKTMIKYKKK